ncbi:MAG TPA: urea transporter, partial [Microcoleaceae cyanobacterium]
MQLVLPMLDLSDPSSPRNGLRVSSLARPLIQRPMQSIAGLSSLWRLVRSLCAATAEILFLRGVGTGALLLAAMLLQPSVLLLGLISVVAAMLFARSLQLDPGYLDRGPLLFNPLLAGLSVGY